MFYTLIFNNVCIRVQNSVTCFSLEIPVSKLSRADSSSSAVAAAVEDLIKPKVDYLPCLFKAAISHFHLTSDNKEIEAFRESLLSELETDHAVYLPEVGSLTLDNLVPQNQESKKPFVRSGH